MYATDFNKLAKLLHHYQQTARGNEAVMLIGDLTDEIADFLVEANPRFDRDYFIEGCEKGID
jgi:hypothetical protein